jgi:diguanylate cyclase (GGDEF)-like protein/PAS domain S-box-containing protein
MFAAGLAMLATAAGAFTPPAQLVVTTDDNYPPYLFRSEDGRPNGIIPDKWDLWSQRTGVPVRITGTTWARAQELVRAGRADVLEAVAMTPGRERLYEFSPAYTVTEARIFFHESIAGINNDVATLRGFTVGAKEGSACGRWLAETEQVAVRNYPTSEAAVAAAGAGELRLFCMDTPAAQYYLLKAHRSGEFRQTAPLYSTSLHWATARGKGELRDFIQDGFAKITPAEMKAIESRWAGSTLGGGLDPRYRDMIIVGVMSAIALAALLLGWNRSLRARVAQRTAELQAAVEAAGKQADLVRDLYNNAPCGYHSINVEGLYVEVNDTELKWLGYSRDEVVGLKRFSDFLDEAGHEAFRTNLARVLEHGEVHDIAYDLIRRDGSILKVLVSATLIRDEAGKPMMTRSTLFDITERNLAEQRIAHLAHHDALTGLPNRTLLLDRLQQAIAHAHRSQTRAAVLFLDLDRFKTINDSLGHAAGDRLLQAAASRIQLCIREEDTVARLGGDEFVVVLGEVTSAGDAMHVAEEIARALNETFRIQSHDLQVTASVGISLYPDDGRDTDSLLKHADTAMYHAKDAGRANCQFFIEAMNVAAQQRLGMENALRRAINNGEFRLQYQPIYDLADRRVSGFEALLRWAPPGRPPILPGDFIAIAEESRLIVPIGEWVLREALTQARRWQSAGHPVRMAVNVSANQLARPQFVERLRQIVAETHFPPSLVDIEVTETAIVEPTGNAREALDAIDALGMGIAIDDFGTGYSGLAYLKRLPIDKVKIDQSFVRDLTVDPDDEAIVTAIVAMAKSLGVDVVAEGIETEAQLEVLRRLGCPRGQGYFLARPMDAAAASALLGITSERLLPHTEELG